MWLGRVGKVPEIRLLGHSEILPDTLIVGCVGTRPKVVVSTENHPVARRMHTTKISSRSFTKDHLIA